MVNQFPDQLLQASYPTMEMRDAHRQQVHLCPPHPFLVPLLPLCKIKAQSSPITNLTLGALPQEKNCWVRHKGITRNINSKVYDPDHPSFTTEVALPVLCLE